MAYFQRGSSPLTRGKRGGESLHVGHLRLIPAHAGKTALPHSWQMSRPAHPRSRGENTLRTLQQGTGPGSSPLTRGKLRPATRRGGCSGLIPAHAGKTSTGSRSPSPPGAHPRSRGENGLRRPPRRCGRGSSPLTRGKRSGVLTLRCGPGLIPAHAGKTFTFERTSAGETAHPRSRGENQVQLILDDGVQGSSPLTRGKLVSVLAARDDAGLIPAHAGKTQHLSTQVACEWAHPRSRGENTS